MLELNGLRGIVCGASRGIGRASAEVLARQGAELTLIARSAAQLEAAIAGLDRTHGQSHRAVIADFAQPDALREIVSAHIAAHGPFVLLVNNTGGPPAGPITEATPQQFLDAARMHVACNQVMAQSVLAGMRAAGFGRIVNIISTSVRQPIAGIGVSNTTRAAVAGWAKTWSNEVARFGITVNNVLPGFTRTERLDELFSGRARRQGISIADVEKTALAETPAGRFATPDEIAAAVAFLCSREAGYITGISLPVDGGRISAI
ncbi:MAG: SDR family oxidoreductase [Phycisphaerales bacterium]|nr:SDR family oxidoreductase [Phycisphaerales bacterium]